MDSIEFTSIKDIKVISKQMNIQAIILSISKIITKAGTKMFTLVISDATGRINCTLFDPNANHLMEGNIITITKVYAKLYQDQLTLYKANTGELWRTGDFTLAINPENNMSKRIINEAPREIPPRDQSNNNAKRFKMEEQPNSGFNFQPHAYGGKLENNRDWSKQQKGGSSSSSGGGGYWLQGNNTKIPIKQRLGFKPNPIQPPPPQNMQPVSKVMQMKRRLAFSSDNHQQQRRDINPLFRKSMQNFRDKSKRFS